MSKKSFQHAASGFPNFKKFENPMIGSRKRGLAAPLPDHPPVRDRGLDTEKLPDRLIIGPLSKRSFFDIARQNESLSFQLFLFRKLNKNNL